MKMTALQDEFMAGRIEKRLYWRLMRENATCILPEIRDLLMRSEDSKKIIITKDDIILEKESGLKMYFNFSDTISRAEADILNGGDPEKNEIELISKLINRKCGVVLDIGANIGMFSIELYQSHQESHYYCFEPIPTTYGRMLRTLKLNNVDEEQFHPFNKGLSNEQGSFDFYLPGASEAASLQPIDDPFYVEKSDDHGNYIGSTNQDVIKCEVDTIDNIVMSNGLVSVDFIKIDVEGNEKNVILGGGKNY